MLHILSMGREPHVQFAAGAIDLLRWTTRVIMLATAGLAALIQITLAATWPRRFQWDLAQVTLVALLACVLGLYLLKRQFILANVIWLAGVAAALLLASHIYREGTLLYLLCVLPFLATVILGWQAGAAAQIGLSVSGAWLADWLGLPSIGAAQHLAMSLGGGFGILIGWASTHALVTAMTWSFYSYQQAEENLQRVREHRAQLSRLTRSLDQAYHQLERANASLVAAWRAAHEAERLKAEFVANVSHELRTPLNLIIGYSEVIVTSPESYGGQQLPPAYRRDIHAIYQSARHLMALVDDVLDLGRIETNKIALAREAVDPAALIKEIEGLIRDYVVAKGLALIIDVAPDLPTIWVDRLRIRQVLLNLVVNAVRFTEQGWIRLNVLAADGEITFRVQDTGRGIDERDLPHIFEPFYTTTEPDQQWHAGTGLGLPISKKLVELHGGRIDVESTPGRGTTFTVTLPINPQRASQASMSKLRMDLPLLNTPAPQQFVIIAPEDPLLVAQIQRSLGEDVQIMGAKTLEEGLRLAAQLGASAVITNEVAPITASTDTLVIQLPWLSSDRIAAQLGAAAFLSKPVSQQQLLAAIDRLGRPIERALIADDDPELVRLFQRMLRVRIPSQRCLEAYNGVEALQRLQEERPDVMILDLGLPDTDGRQVIARMLSDESLPRVPVIAISGLPWRDLEIRLTGPILLNRRDGFFLHEVGQIIGQLLTGASPRPGMGAGPEDQPAPVA